MSTLYWIATGFFIIGALSTIAIVGKPRDPISGGAAAVITVINIGLIYLLVYAAQRL